VLVRSALGLVIGLIVTWPSGAVVPDPVPAAALAASAVALPPGAVLPSGDACARSIRRDPWEPRPGNRGPNHAVPPGPVDSRSWADPRAEVLRSRVTGRFAGTTDEIIRWASCKWGFDPDVTRAQAVQESGWHQSSRGDGGASVGLLQIKSTVWTGTLPWSADSTAFNVDWSLGLRRACFEGYLFSDQGSRGDLWGCVGAHYSGHWRDGSALAYVDEVRGHLARREWREWPSPAGVPPP
jgi:autotransporter family porin